MPLSFFLTNFLQGEQEDCKYNKEFSRRCISKRKRQFQHNCFHFLPQKNTDFSIICLLIESRINNTGRKTKSVKTHISAISVEVFNITGRNKSSVSYSRRPVTNLNSTGSTCIQAFCKMFSDYSPWISRHCNALHWTGWPHLI